jgi:hypothetical protein
LGTAGWNPAKATPSEVTLLPGNLVVVPGDERPEAVPWSSPTGDECPEGDAPQVARAL